MDLPPRQCIAAQTRVIGRMPGKVLIRPHRLPQGNRTAAQVTISLDPSPASGVRLELYSRPPRFAVANGTRAIRPVIMAGRPAREITAGPAHGSLPVVRCYSPGCKSAASIAFRPTIGDPGVSDIPNIGRRCRV